MTLTEELVQLQILLTDINNKLALYAEQAISQGETFKNRTLRSVSSNGCTEAKILNQRVYSQYVDNTAHLTSAVKHIASSIDDLSLVRVEPIKEPKLIR